MISLPVTRLKDGMITAQSIYNSSGASYLTRGSKLSQQYIEKLRQIGISNVVITSLDPDLPLPPPEDIIKEDTRVNAIHQICETYSRLQQDENIEFSPLLGTAEKIIADLIKNPDNLVQMTDIRLYDDYTFAHSVNVAALSAMLGIICGYSKEDLTTLTMGALLHDVGKLDVNINILNKPGTLNDNEFEVIRNHPEAGWRRLCSIYDPGLDMRMIASIAYQHHEHLDGHGYPRHLTRDNICEFARIVAIADVYDALTTQRPYKKAYAPHIAYQIMTKCSGKQFEPKLLSLFFDHVSLFPVGSVVKTTMGYGIVQHIHTGMTRFPRIIIFADNNPSPLPKPSTVETFNYGPDFIQTVLDGNELRLLCMRLQFNPAKLIINKA